MAADRLCELVDNLPNSVNKTDDLQQIKILTGQLTRRALADLVPNISFNVIFECLDTEEVEEVSACCDVLGVLLDAADVSLLLPQFHDDLLQGLGHTSQDVKLLCLRQVQHIADSCPQELCRHHEVLQKIISVIGEESLHVAKNAANCLMTMGSCSEAVEFLFSGEGLSALTALTHHGDDIRFRVYEFVTDIARLSSENLTLCAEAGLLQKLVNEVHKDDILIQLNCLEILTRLAMVSHGLAYMEQQGILTKLHQMLQDVDSDPMTGFLLPGLVKFFGAVAFLQPKEVCQRHPSFLPRVFGLCESADPAERALGAETIGLMGSTVDGKHLLEQHRSTMNIACKCMGALLKDPSNDIKVRILGAIRNLLKLDVPDQTTDLLSLLESWYTLLAPDTLALFMDLLERPFNNIRCAVYAIMVVIATQPWAQTRFKEHAMFCEFLLNRGTENTKEGKEAKYSVIKDLESAPTTIEIMGRVYHVKLKEYVREGPFFVQAESAVAMDSET